MTDEGPNKSPHLRSLASHIIGENFGPIVQQTSELLLNRFPGTATAPQLEAHCRPLEASAVRRSLLVLLRHNLINVGKLEVEKDSARTSAPLIFSIRLVDVANRLHFPQYSLMASEVFGPIVSSPAAPSPQLRVHLVSRQASPNQPTRHLPPADTDSASVPGLRHR